MLPVLDLRQYASGQDPEGFAKEMGRACREQGAFLLKDHAIPRALFNEVRAASRQFFALPETEKERLDIRNSSANRGWAGVGVEQHVGAEGVVLPKESFSMGLDLRADDPRVMRQEPFRGVNLWPDSDVFRDAFRDTMRDYYKEMLGLGRVLMRVAERDLELPQGFFQPYFSEPMATLRLSRFLSDPWGVADAVSETHPQYDYGAFTFVLSDGASGLQFQTKSGQWCDMPDVPGCLIVLVGDALMRWSNDLYRSVPHRVRSSEHERYLSSFYLDSNPESVIAPLPRMGTPLYPAVLASDFLRNRLEETYLSSARSKQAPLIQSPVQHSV